MPYYKRLFDRFAKENDAISARRAAERLLSLRGQLKNELPARTVSDTLLLATWNLREFGRNQKYGPRLNESLQYIAEIISHFDLVAVQEVHENLKDLHDLMYLLGDWWSYIVTDVTPGRSGNQERTAFIFDTRKVKFDHLAGELVLPDQPAQPSRQPARSPFVCGFRVGWRRISVCSVHIYYGSKDPNDPLRVAEIDAIAGLLAKRNTRRQESADGEPDIVILLGDFNIFHQKGDKTMAALERHNFIVPKKLAALARPQYYDQIAFHDPRRRLRTAVKAGVFDFSTSIFRDEDAAAYNEVMRTVIPVHYARNGAKSSLFRTWKTFQISDHRPLWIELQVDFTNGYLAIRGGVNRKRSGDPAVSNNASGNTPVVVVATPRVAATGASATG